MTKKFRFSLRKRNKATALPPSTTQKNVSNSKNKKLGKKKIGYELNTAPSPSTDEVSLLTNLTGMPPEQSTPDRLRNLGQVAPLLPPNNNQGVATTLYTGTYSPPSTPSKDGGMNINVLDTSVDEISVMTPSGIPSPDKGTNKSGQQQQRMAPQILNYDGEDDDSQDLIVYEDEKSDDYISTAETPQNTVDIPLPIRLKPTTSSPLFPLSSNDNDNKQLTPSKKVSFKKSKRSSLSKAASKKLISSKSWLTSTKFFERRVESAFQTVDVDKSGDVTCEELYAGLLLIHLKMAIYVGAPACRPASKNYVTEIFHLLDKDNSGTLCKEEFATVMKILYSQVFTRILIHWFLTLMIVPVITQYIIKYTSLLLWIVHEFWKDIDDDLDPLQRLLWKLWDIFLYFTPQFLDSTGVFICVAFSKIPKGVWRSMPYTILTIGQVSVVLPWALGRVENFFRWAAHSDVEKKNDNTDAGIGNRLKEC